MKIAEKLPVRRTDGQATEKRILVHAEELFSVYGYDGVSLRKITGKAGVDLALIKYYFGSKEGLFRAVLIGRIDAMSKQRLVGLAKTKIVTGSQATIEELLTVFVQPMIGDDAAQIEELRNYRLLVALVTNSKIWQHEVFQKHYDPVSLKFIEALGQTLPDVAYRDICWAFSFFLGSLVNAFAETRRVDRLSQGVCQSTDLYEIRDQLVQYTTAALLNLPKGKS
mgnify:CR=1 FL=1